MCWVTQGNPVERVAKDDISVFKYVLGDDLTSYYFTEHKYVIGETLYTTLGFPGPVIGLRGAQSVARGFHSYGSGCTIREFDRYLDVYPPHQRYSIGSYVLYKLTDQHYHHIG